jgi:glycosyltransferase involved in cell wall biosynthesis
MSHSLRTNPNPFISAVVPAFNEGQMIQKFVQALSEHLAMLTDHYEIIVIDDGSRDHTAEQVKAIVERFPLKLLTFSRNFGKEKAITAGLNNTSGDVVLIIDSDFQHPMEVIAQFLEKWREGYDNVYGIRDRHDQTFLNRFFANRFYKLNKHLMSIDLPPNAGDFRLMDRRVVEAIRTLPESNRFMKGLYAWVGFKGIGVPYKVQRRAAGKSRFNFMSLLNLAITGITSFSDWPLRIWSLIGVLVSLGSLIYGIWIMVYTLAYGNSVPGWATLAVGVLFLGGIQLISIGVIAEYIARIFNEVKRRPPYIVAEKIGFEQEKQ